MTGRHIRLAVALVTSLALFSVVPGTLRAQDAKAALSEAAKALGVDSLNTVQYSATGFDFVFASGPTTRRAVAEVHRGRVTRVVDFKTPASKVDRIRMQGENPPRGAQPVIGEQPQSQTIIVNATTPWVNQLEDLDAAPRVHSSGASQKRHAESQTVGGKRYDVLTFMGDNKAL
jgi:hypothetical protein